MDNSTPRRSFFKLVIDEFAAVVDEGQGRPSFKLSELGELADDALGGLVPAISDVSNVTSHENSFVLKRSRGDKITLFAKGSREEEIWSRINGDATIRQIADDLALQWNEPSNVAFNQVRALFLFLVSNNLCLPLNPLV